MVKVVARNGESQQQLLRRFKQRVSRSGVLSTIRKKRWFVSKNEQRRIERKKAIRRHERRLQKKNSRR
ncbi:MAG: 30S ribosomal protein S21 [Anaerolineales bacterium]|nr:30S ribosomal protein S21 [Anaerolineales bacterium]